MTDELLARRILALEERIERVETSGLSTQRVILDALADLRRDTADRFERLERRFEERFGSIEERFGSIEMRFGSVEQMLGQILALIGGPPGRGNPPQQ